MREAEGASSTAKDLIDSEEPRHTLFCREAAVVVRMLRMGIKFTVLCLLGKKAKEKDCLKHLAKFDTKVNSPDV